MQAVIIAGGAGTRLRPLTYTIPKPMVPLFNKPFLQYQVELLRRHGIKDIIINLHYLAHEINDYFGDGSNLGVRIQYSTEETPLGTAGAVKRAESLFTGEPLLVMNGDILTDLDLGDLMAFHRQKQARATITLIRVSDPTAYGLVILDKEDRVLRFLEKPTWDEAVTDTINAGFYILDPDVFRYVPVGEAYSFERGLFPLLLQLDEPFYGYIMEGYWLDIGSPQKYVQAHHDILTERVKVELPARRRDGAVWVGEDTDIDPSAELRGPLFLGNQVKVRKKARVMEYAVLGDGVVVDDRSYVERTIVGSQTVIAEDARLVQCLVGRECQIQDHVQINAGAVIADRSVIARGTRIGNWGSGS